MNELTAPELLHVCNEAKDWEWEMLDGKDFHKAVCQWYAYGAATASSKDGVDAMRVACTNVYNRCLNMPAPSPTDPICPTLPVTCRMTVGELETCLNDTPAFMTEALVSFPACQTLTVGELMAVYFVTPDDRIQVPPSCLSAAAKCNTLLDYRPQYPLGTN